MGICYRLGRSGTARGRNKWWSNIRGENDVLSSLNMEELDAWEYIDEEVLLSHVESNDVLLAKMRELKNLKQHTVYEEVEDNDMRKVETTWVITENWKKGLKGWLQGVFRKDKTRKEKIRPHVSRPVCD